MIDGKELLKTFEPKPAKVKAVALKGLKSLEK